jgi:hypothetical protein
MQTLFSSPQPLPEVPQTEAVYRLEIPRQALRIAIAVALTGLGAYVAGCLLRWIW